MAATALTIGTFDGVHLGHAALVRRARELVGAGGRVVALAFEPHPLSVLRPEAAPARLTTFERRAELLRQLGADDVVQLEPTPSRLSQTPEEFARELVERYGPAAIVEGDDFRFGKGRGGDVRSLADLGSRLRFRVEVVPPVEVPLSDQLIVRASSSVVRWLISNGRVRDAAIVLGRPYELTGVVTKGDQVGRKIGFPTANVDTPCLVPLDGIYAGLGVLPNGETVAAAVNVGTRPTFNGKGRRAEAHLMPLRSDGSERLSEPALGTLPEYGWTLTLRLIAWLRDDARFESVESLVEQIGRDCERTLRLLALESSREHASV